MPETAAPGARARGAAPVVDAAVGAALGGSGVGPGLVRAPSRGQRIPSTRVGNGVRLEVRSVSKALLVFRATFPFRRAESQLAMATEPKKARAPRRATRGAVVASE